MMPWLALPWALASYASAAGHLLTAAALALGPAGITAGIAAGVLTVLVWA